MLCVSPGAGQAVTLLADVSHPGSQEGAVSSGDPAHSLVEDVDSGAKVETAPCLLALAVACLPLCVRRWRALYGSWLALLWYLAFGILFWYSRNPVLGEHARGHHAVLEPFAGKVFFYFFVSLAIPWFG